MTKTLNALVVVLLGSSSPALAQPAQTPEPPLVLVQGEGVVRMAPDQALLRIGAESRSRIPKEAQTTNAEAMAAVQQRIAAAGIPKEAVRTVAISLQQEFDYAGGRQTPRGYVARNVIEVRVDDLAKLGELMDAAVSSGATSIQGLQFDLKQRDTHERQALTRAVADGLARAEAAAAGARRTVDRVIRIEEAGPVDVIRPQSAAFTARIAGDAAPPPTPVAEGEIEIRAKVTLTAVIK